MSHRQVDESPESTLNSHSCAEFTQEYSGTVHGRNLRYENQIESTDSSLVDMGLGKPGFQDEKGVAGINVDRFGNHVDPEFITEYDIEYNGVKAPKDEDTPLAPGTLDPTKVDPTFPARKEK
mmetsp:Transcript_9901/g.18660  ORF Transcript_9901/g.18660 Transcript_9901/m.18660 type:complete len:122 (+) Transcript_9901:282-647(+)